LSGRKTVWCVRRRYRRVVINLSRITLQTTACIRCIKSTYVLSRRTTQWGTAHYDIIIPRSAVSHIPADAAVCRVRTFCDTHDSRASDGSKNYRGKGRGCDYDASKIEKKIHNVLTSRAAQQEVIYPITRPPSPIWTHRCTVPNRM